MTTGYYTFPDTIKITSQMVTEGYIDGSEYIYTVSQYLMEHVTEQECREMLQELVDVATIKNLCH